MAAPKNPANRWTEKEWRDAVRKAVNDIDKKGVKVINNLAKVLVAEGLAGNMVALQEIGNRLDGRPAQDMHITGNVSHDLSGVSDAQLAAIIAETASGDRSAEAPDDPRQLN